MFIIICSLILLSCRCSLNPYFDNIENIEKKKVITDYLNSSFQIPHNWILILASFNKMLI